MSEKEQKNLSPLEEIYNSIAPEQFKRFELAEEFGRWLQTTLEEREIKIWKFADSTGFSDHDVMEIINGEKDLTLEQMSRITLALDSDIKIIINDN